MNEHDAAIQLYNNYLMETEGREISYGELAYIYGLSETELKELQNEIERTLQ